MAPKKTSSPYTTTRDQRKPVSCTICGISQVLAMESFPVESLPPAAAGADLGVEVGDHDGGHGEQHHGGAGGAPSQLTASEGVGVLEVGEARVLEQLLEPEPWVQHPLPRGPGDDEGECHRIEVDGPERALLPDALVEEDGDEEAQDQAQGDVEDPEHRQVVERHRPARMVPDALVVEPADELVAGDATRPGKGEVQRPERSEERRVGK